MLHREIVRLPFAVVLALCVTALICRSPTAPATRTAIRVSCDAPGACALAEALALDVWSEQRGPELDVVVTDRELAELAAAGVHWQVLVPDIDLVAAQEAARLYFTAQPADFFAEYRDYRAITERLHELAELAPARAQVVPLGSSLDGRTIWALRVGTRGAPRMLLNGTQHAREWISPMVTTCIADRLVRDYDRDPAIKEFVDGTELWIVPVVNPDGYQYSWSSNRYWRKNRRDGHGVDLNRNFSIAWGGDGSSSRKRAEDYHGEYAFSEPETAALRDLVKREGIAAHIDFHSYGQLLLYPWNYTATPAKDRARFAAVGDRVASAMFAQHGTRYRLMSGVELYPAAGTMSDWMYGDVEALSYTIELRPRGGTGFVLPPEQIRPTCDEGFAAVRELRGAL